MNELGIAVVGAGMAGQTHMAAYRQTKELLHQRGISLRLVAVADVNVPLATEAASEFGFASVVDDWRELAKDDSVDVVSVVVANRLHREIVEGLLAAGKHVLCEKPLADSILDAESMVAAADRARGLARVGFTYLRAPGISAILRRVQDGTLGPVRHLSGNYWTEYATDAEAPINWRYKGGPGSGVLADLGSHLIYLAEAMCGPAHSVRGAQFSTALTSRPVPVGATVGHQKTAVTGEYEPVENEDFASFTLKFADAVGTLQMSRIAYGQPNGLSLEIVCERGSARFTEDRPDEAAFYFDAQGPTDGWVTVSGPDEGSALLPHPVARGTSHADDFVYQAIAFVQEVAGHPTDESHFANATFADGLHNMRILAAVTESALNDGRKVDI